MSNGRLSLMSRTKAEKVTTEFQCSLYVLKLISVSQLASYWDIKQNIPPREAHNEPAAGVTT